jgi:hypothetical protein
LAALCRPFAAHPPAIYDRTPIVVSKNSCALPERGGRTYVLEEQLNAESASRSRQHGASSRSYHPRALNNPATHYRSVDSEHRSLADLPQLVPDLSSESDESDGFTSSPHIPQHHYSYGAHGLPTKYESSTYDYSPSSSKDGINALAFLPYPPSPPSNYSCSTDESAQASKPRKKRSESRRRHDGATDPDRIPSTTSRRREYLASMQHSGFGATDDGCLGGF